MPHFTLQAAVTVQGQWWILLLTTNLRTTSLLLPELASRVPQYMISQTGEAEIQTWHSKIVPSSSWRSAPTPSLQDMKATDNCGTVLAGKQRRTSTPIRWEQLTEMALTRRNHSTSQLSRSQTVVLSGKKRSSIFAINEQRDLRKHVKHALETSNPFKALLKQVRYTD